MGFLVRSLHIPSEAKNKNQISSYLVQKKKKGKNIWPERAILPINIDYYLLKQTLTLKENIRRCTHFISNLTFKIDHPHFEDW